MKWSKRIEESGKHDHNDRVSTLGRGITAHCVDGLFIVPVYTSKEAIRPLKEMTIPRIMITNYADDVDSVYISLEKAGDMVAKHLVSIGVNK